jgi:hypothetical protein
MEKSVGWQRTLGVSSISWGVSRLADSHLWSTPVAFAFCRTYDAPGQSSAACKALKVLKTTVLKRLASAVQLRPWPPSF